MNVDLIKKYFDDFSDKQSNQLEELNELYQDWNQKINVISRKDIDSLYLHHVLHSLTIIPFYPFSEGAEVLDLGTGGGFPGIPLAIFYPEVRFTLIDGTAKKLKVVQSVVDKLELKNVRVKHQRAEESKHSFDMIVTRAVANVEKLLFWGRPLLKKKHQHSYPNGIIAYKGGDINSELEMLPSHEYHEQHSIYKAFPEDYFQDKFIVYIQG